MLVGFGEWWEVAAETSLQARVHEHFLMSMCFPEAEYEQSLPQRSSASVRRSTLLKGLVCMIVRVGWICPSRFAEGMFARSAPTKTPAASPPYASQCFASRVRGGFRRGERWERWEWAPAQALAAFGSLAECP